MGGSDGSVVIDTELDQEGFDAGSDKLIKSLEKLTASMDRLGDRLTGAFQGVLPLLQSVSTGVGQVYADMSSGAADLNSGVASLDRSVASLSGDLSKIDASIEKGFSSPGAVLKFKELMDGAEVKANALRARMAELASQRVPTEEYTFLSNAIRDAGDKLSALKDRQDKLKETGVAESSKQWQSLAYDIEQVRGQLANYNAEKAELEASGGAFIQGADTEPYKAMEAVLRQTDAQLERGRALINDEALAQAQLNVQAAQEGVIRAKTDGERQAALERLRGAQQELISLAAELTQKGGGAPPPETASRWSALGSVLHGCAAALGFVARSALSATKSLAKMGFKALENQVKSYTSKLAALVKTNKSVTLTSNGLVKALTSIKTMLKSRIKRMFITYLMNEVKEALSSLVQYSTKFDAAVSNMRNSASQLAGNIAVSFSELVNAVSPAITSIINLLSDAVTYLNSFFAMLSGKSAVTVAKKQTDSYAASLSGAAGAAKKLENQLFGFDELTRVQDDSDSDGSGDKSGADKFEEVPIESILPAGLGDWFGQIKAAFAAGDWRGIGTIITSGLNTAMSAVDGWINGTLRPLAVTWAERIANGLNGAVAGIDWSLAGMTLGGGINTVFEAVNTFLTTFDFTTLGSRFATALNTLFDTIDWGLLGQTFANKWNALVSTIYGFVTTFNWGDLGLHLSEMVNGWFNEIDWAKAGTTFSEALKGVLTSIYTFLENTDWQAIGNDIAEFLRNVDWAGISDAIFEGIGAALGALAALLWRLIKDAWDDVVGWWHDVAFDDGQFTMQGLLDGIWQKIKDIGSWIKQHIFDPFINGFKKAFGISSPSKVMKEQGGFIVEGLLNGIKNTWSSVVNFFGEKLSSITSTISKAWTNIKEKASSAWSGIKSTLSSKLSDIGSSVSSTFSNIVSKATSWGKDLCSNMANGINAAKSWVSNAVSSVADKIKGFLGFSEPDEGPLSNFHTYMPDMLKLMAKGIRDNAYLATNAVSDLAGSMSSEVSDMTVGNGIVRVADALAGVAQTFISIADALAAMGGLRVPAIAEGTVAPYRMRTSAAPGVASEPSGIGAEILTILREILMTLDDAGDGRDINVTVESVLDGEVIARNTVRHINDRTRQAGRPVLLV